MDEHVSDRPNGVNGHLTPLQAESSVYNSHELGEYLSGLLSITLGADAQDLERDGSLLSPHNSSTTFRRFISFLNEPQKAIFLEKHLESNGHILGDVGLSVSVTHAVYILSSEITAKSNVIASVALVKKSHPLDTASPLSGQLQVVNLPGLGGITDQPQNAVSPIESLHSIVHSALSPYLHALAKSQTPITTEPSKSDIDQRAGIAEIKKKIAELEFSLLQLKQNDDIPRLLLTLHPAVQAALDTALERGAEISINLIPAALTEDSGFYNSLQSVVNSWIKNIRMIVKASRDVNTGTASQEINFWLDMETALENIETQLRSDGVKLTMDLLKAAKRHQATISLVADTGLHETLIRVQGYNQLMRGFPLVELLSAPSLHKVRDSLDLIFAHMNKKIKVCPYPIQRALLLLEAISADLDTRVHDLLNGRAIMQTAYAEFEKVMDQTEAIWRIWDDNIKDFTTVARDYIRKRGDKIIPIKVGNRHAQTQARLRYVSTFRANHEQLLQTIGNVLNSASILGPGDFDDIALQHRFDEADAVHEISEAYTALGNVDVLDVSVQGTLAWQRAEIAYGEQTSRVENTIIATLRDRLATVKTANEMFRVFSKFNALFIRPRIRGAISEYQTQLINNVKQDIIVLQQRFQQQYGHVQAHAMAQLHDLPPVSGAIIWTRQIERQLDNYMKRVEDVLGTQWHLHADGRKLKMETMNFRQKLDTRPVYETWLQDVARRNMSMNGYLFSVSKSRAAISAFELAVNFDPHITTLSKEVQNLIWLDFSIPHAINTVSKDVRRVYPYAVSLMESVRTFLQTSQLVAGMSDVSVLLHEYRLIVHRLLMKGTHMRWESFARVHNVHIRQATADSATFEGVYDSDNDSRHVQLVKNLAFAISTLQSKSEALLSIDETIHKSLTRLETCPYCFDVFQRELHSIQGAVDLVNLENYKNLCPWVAKLNCKINSILSRRLDSALTTWLQLFRALEIPGTSPEKCNQVVKAAYSDTYPLTLKHLVHKIVIRNQTISVEPPLDLARSTWISQFHGWIGIVCNLQRIETSRYTVENHPSTGDCGFRRFTGLLAYNAEKLAFAYRSIENFIGIFGGYVDQWLQFQSLWDLQDDIIHELLGDNLGLWLHLLQEIRETRSTIDNANSTRQFGILSIDYGQVQVKINAKYDQWQNEIVTKFAAMLGDHVSKVHAHIRETRMNLETCSLDASSTAQTVIFITSVQNAKHKVSLWGAEIELFRKGQTALARQRYHFSSDWQHVERVDDDWAALTDILTRKSKVLLNEIDALRAKIAAEENTINRRIISITTDWNEQRPVSGTMPADEALAILHSFKAKLLKLADDSDMLSKAKEALDLAPSQNPSLIILLEEVQDFVSVWAALSTIWTGLHDLRSIPWASVQPRKLKQSLDGLLAMGKDLPVRMRQYAAYEYLQNILRQLVRVNAILSDLRSDVVRERHWTKIFKTLQPSTRYIQIEMTLGNVWDLQLAQRESVIRDILSQAQGEMALEEFLRQVRETWQSYTFDLVIYRTKCKLVRGWDDLFARCSDNINSLQAMRYSPYITEFADEASLWEQKLTRVHTLFDVWFEVQRQWVYLEGVFNGNSDIKHLLPLETGRFQYIDSEFLTIMNKVQKSPYVLSVLDIPEMQKTMERLAEFLSKIQKALGEYLDKERAAFPRFYFVGDEDLLEIIGNGIDTTRMSRHLGKMFAGISGLLTDESSNIVGFFSSQGEEVNLGHGISLVKYAKVSEWLPVLETAMKDTLAERLGQAIETFPVTSGKDFDSTTFDHYVKTLPGQIVVLAMQVWWTKSVEAALDSQDHSLSQLHRVHLMLLRHFAKVVLQQITVIERTKCENLITELVHQQEVIEQLIERNVDNTKHHLWLLQMRYEYKADNQATRRLQVKMANASLDYGFEYLGVISHLVRTPLTERCFLTLTQALSQRLGGSPYGPAGTGKTETVKALGAQLGRCTLIFCCGDNFDFKAMDRIFLGICQVGAWGCFDEFNRLDERILSAVSQQVQNIQSGLKRQNLDRQAIIELAGRSIEVNPTTGIFITMNPGYAGRSNLPDNLKKLFRSVAMSKPDKETIAEVILYSQGYHRAHELSKQTVLFFDACSARLSRQSHYDFGLRALKSVLVHSGNMKRRQIVEAQPQLLDDQNAETQIVLQGLHEIISPKLLRQDTEILEVIEAEIFPQIRYSSTSFADLSQAIHDIMQDRQMVINHSWITKTMQLFQIIQIHHGVMMVGRSGCGKTSTWSVLLQALQKVDGIEAISYIIDPKVMSLEALYGRLDSTTREWTDGLFTSILRKIVDNLRGESAKRHWIVFDGDVDPEWVENLNSILDDNKLLTLPNGERLVLPSNVRILFEVETLQYATPATVSRCGMVWFADDNLTSDMRIAHYLERLKLKPFEDFEEDLMSTSLQSSSALDIQIQVANILAVELANGGFINSTLLEAGGLKHIMEWTQTRALCSLFALLDGACKLLIAYNVHHPEFPLQREQIECFMRKRLLLAIIWCLAGDCPLAERQVFGDMVTKLKMIEIPKVDDCSSIIDFQVSLPENSWSSWQDKVPTVEVDIESVIRGDLVIPTVDTVRLEDVLYSWLGEHRLLVLCGPPGSGKTMMLFSALRKLPNSEVVGLNFASATTPELVLKSFEQYCEYRKTSHGIVLSPTHIGRHLVVFCDEINLPAPDKYGTQRAISFLRQMIEHNGFWRTSDKTWITLSRVQFVGACNPPTDPGRVPLGLRLLRHAAVVMVDYPGEVSLHQIYGSFNRAILGVIPLLRGYAQALTHAMIQLYKQSQKRFTPAIQPHYIYSPRELTRWVKGVYEAIKPLENLDLGGLVRIWAHEALRLFQDRLVDESERLWTRERIQQIGQENFPSVVLENTLSNTLLFSNWLSKDYVPVESSELRDFVKARLKTFCEEEVDIPLVLHDEALDHVLRIDRVFRQPQGHVILIGISGSGKTTLSRFVAWMNGLKVFQLKLHRKYSSDEFDDDLRDVLRRCGCRAEKICFIMDESNILNPVFLERMNTLLANAEVPGLFEGDELTALMNACREGAQRQSLLLDSHDELYKWFTQQIVRNLHVVFTMNPPEEGLASRAATSPALFNRCVLNWFGNWSDRTLYQVGWELTQSLDLDRGDFIAPKTVPVAYRGLNIPPSYREVVLNAIVYMHQSVHQFNLWLKKQQNKVLYLTPRHFLDFVDQYSKLYKEKREELEKQQRHLNIGLQKLRETVEKVRQLKKGLGGQRLQLEQKDKEANEKLQHMINDQQQAEKRRAASLEIQAALDKQETAISKRKDILLADLAHAEPAVLEAQKSVSNIKKQHLTEIRSMASPPAGVKLALEAVCTLLGHRVENWKAIQAIVRRDDFIASIVNYDNESQMTPSHRTKMRKEYLALEEFTYERVNRASKACGPLVQWVQAHVNFSEILDRVGPLRKEVEVLEDQALETKAKAKAIDNKLAELEQSIVVYKSEYASLISETEAIKREMERIHSKVERSLRLLDSLAAERKRWEESSKSFDVQIDTLVGDVLAAAAFITYCGPFDQQYRKMILEDWLDHLSNSGIKFKPLNNLGDYLSTADEVLQWQRNTLPVDDLCTENAIMLQRANRYPFIIDPTGRIIDFQKNEHQQRSQRLTITSFLDANFIKQLESALRFGNTILIQDAEHLDPILNHVLNREYQRTGGRVLVQLGKQEIDFSPSFKLFLLTRDFPAFFSPDSCSRTTLINFTVTQSSLQSQALNKVLRSERPDVDERRDNLIKLHGGFEVQLRHLEKRLLQSLNEARGNILDDDTIINTLETIKKEVGVITAKMIETEGVMIEVDNISFEYRAVSMSCSAIFAVLEHLKHINHFYQFSLDYFIEIFDQVLRSNQMVGTTEDHKVRVDRIVNSLFTATYQKTSLTILQKDRITLAMLLAQAAPYKLNKSLLDSLLDDDIHFGDASSELNDTAALLNYASSLSVFKNEDMSPSELESFVTEEQSEKHIPLALGRGQEPLDTHMRALTLTKALRADRLLPAAERFISQIFGEEFFDGSWHIDDLIDQASASTPIALCCSAGFDASFRVDHVVEQRRVHCSSIAMGSVEVLESADKAISEAAATGSWVFIKNVHLALPWLQGLEKRLVSLKPQPGFRLFLSMETSPNIPVRLLKIARVVMCEQPAGIKASIKDSFFPSSSRATKPPTERTRIYLLLSLLHGIIQERLRYAPTLGWTANWEFNDSDYDCAVNVLDAWIEWAAQGRTNINPTNIPWEMIQALTISTYSGKIDNEEDFIRLARLVKRILTPATFNQNFDIANAVAMEDVASKLDDTFMLPMTTGFEDFEEWVNQLPDREPPSYLGLPAHAEKVLLVERGKDMIRNIKLVMGKLEESEQLMAEITETT